MRETGDRKGEAIVTSLLRKAIDHRTARIAKTQQLRHLVIGLARRVVSRPADETVVTGRRYEIEARVAA